MQHPVANPSDHHPDHPDRPDHPDQTDRPDRPAQASNAPSRLRNLPLAVILATGLAAGIGLTRPAGSPTPPAAASTPAGSPDGTGSADGDASDGPSESGDAGTPTTRPGARRAGGRSGNATAPAPAGSPADQQPGSTASAEATIVIENFAFDGPAAIAPGAALTVTNRDGVAHTLSFRTGDPDTGTVDGGASATVTAPTQPGTYAYFCRIHPAMQGEIDVTG